MIYSKLYQKDTTDCSWEVAHLYEHAVVHDFFAYLSKNGIEPSVIGWIDAQTFEHSIFFFGVFYSKDVIELFEKYMSENKPTKIPLDVLVLEIGIEDNVTYSISDQAEFNKQLDTVSKHEWKNIDSQNDVYKIDETQKITSPLSKKKTAKDYRKVIISYSLKNGTSIERALFLRWSVILDDIFSRSIEIGNDLRMICHGVSSSPVFEQKDSLTRIQSIAIPKSTSIELIKSKITKSLKDFDVDKSFKYIKEHMKNFAEQPLWRDFSVDYFRHTGLITSNKYIASLCTIDNIKSINKKIVIKVCYQTPELKKHLYIQ